MFDTEFVKWLATLGVGGALAGVIFYFYRIDARVAQAQWRGQAEQLMTVVKENTTAIAANSQVVASMSVMIDMLIRRMDNDRTKQNARRDDDGHWHEHGHK